MGPITFKPAIIQNPYQQTEQTELLVHFEPPAVENWLENDTNDFNVVQLS